MFKYDQFPILKIQVYNSQGTLHNKKFRLKSHQPYTKTQSYSLINVIDFETSQHLTLKKIFKTKDLCKENTLAEIYNQSKMKYNSNFIQIKQVYEDHENIYLLMQQVQVNLQQILKNRVILLQKEVQYIFCQLVTILECLRRNNIFHGGITLNNLYLDQQTMKLKLSGFQHSINLQKVKYETAVHQNLYSHTDISPYIAPQLFDSNIENAYVYYCGDIWAIGVVIYTLLIGYQPFMNSNYDANRNQIKTPSLMKIKNYLYEFPKSQLKSLLQQQSNHEEGFEEQNQQQINRIQQQNSSSMSSIKSLSLKLNSQMISKIQYKNSKQLSQSKKLYKKMNSMYTKPSGNKTRSIHKYSQSYKSSSSQLSNYRLFALQINDVDKKPDTKRSRNTNQNRNIPQVSQIWKQLLKKIFIQKQKRVTLIQLIEHPLNNITEQKFIQLAASCRHQQTMHPPSLSHHYISKVDIHLQGIRFDHEVQAMFVNNYQNHSQKIGKFLDMNVYKQNCSKFEYLDGSIKVSKIVGANDNGRNMSKNKSKKQSQKLAPPPNLYMMGSHNRVRSSGVNSSINSSLNINMKADPVKNKKQLLTGGQQNTLILNLILQQTRSRSQTSWQTDNSQKYRSKQESIQDERLQEKTKQKFKQTDKQKDKDWNQDKMKNTSNFNNYTNTNTKIQVQNNNINDNGSVSKEWKKSSINMMNRQGLMSSMNKRKRAQRMPLIIRMPSFIQKYCYVQKHRCMGYILDNLIGVIYEDGSCILGTNASEYVYKSNEPINIQHLLNIYCAMYDQHYNSSNINSSLDGISTRHQYNHDKDYVASYNYEGNNNSDSDTSDRQNLASNNSNNAGISNTDSDYIQQNAKNTQSINWDSVNLNTNSNYNISKLGTNSVINNKPPINFKTKKSKMIQLANLNFINNNSSNASNIFKTDNNIDTIKFGQPFYTLSFNNINLPQHSTLQQLNRVNSKNTTKMDIYKYVISLFGERVLQTNFNECEYIVGSWKLNCGFVFLYNTGTWQVNFNLEHNTNSQPDHLQQLNINAGENLSKNNLNDKNRVKKERRSKQCAILIDKYGISWWLNGTNKSNRSRANCASLNWVKNSSGSTNNYKSSNSTDVLDFTMFNNYSNCWNDKNKGKGKNNLANGGASNKEVIQHLDEGYNALCVKIARRIVSIIKKQYVLQFQDMMEPYKYNRC